MTYTGTLLSLVQPNSTRLNLYVGSGGAAPTTITNTAFTNTSAIYATATYEAQ